MRRLAPALIALGLLGLLARVPVAEVDSLRLDLATVVLIAAGFYFVVMEWRVGLAALAGSIVLYVAGAALPLVADVALLAAGLLLLDRGPQLRLARHRE